MAQFAAWALVVALLPQFAHADTLIQRHRMARAHRDGSKAKGSLAGNSTSFKGKGGKSMGHSEMTKASAKSKGGKGSSPGKGKSKGKSGESPATFPSASPTSSPTPFPCMATSGNCVGDLSTLVDALTGPAASAGDVVAICNGATIAINSVTTLSLPPDMTLCCQDNDGDCLIDLGPSGGFQSPSNLYLNANSFTLSHVDFEGGFGFPASQLSVVGNGDHYIRGCTFSNSGFSGQGMAYVETPSQVDVEDCTFTSGNGLAVVNAIQLKVASSNFIGNAFNGLILSWNSDLEGRSVEIEKSVFTDNAYEGLLASHYGHFPRISILQSEFSRNGASGFTSAGAGTFCCPENFPEVVMSENTGTGNTGSTCPDFLFWAYPILDPINEPFGTEVITCVDADEEIEGI